MILRTRNSDLQREAGRGILASRGLLWLVVGGSGRALKARSGLDRCGTGVSPVCSLRRAGLKHVRTGETPVPLHRAAAFTLMELLLVLALLAVAVAVAAPSLSRFFHGRALDSESRRMLALTRYAQSRAVSEGVPMVMWFKPDESTYGVQAETTYTGTDDKAVEYQLDSALQLELPPASLVGTAPWKITTQISGNQPAIRFTPDGFISDTSPVWVRLKLTDEPDAVWLAMDDNRVKYELQTIQPR